MYAGEQFRIIIIACLLVVVALLESSVTTLSGGQFVVIIDTILRIGLFLIIVLWPPIVFCKFFYRRCAIAAKLEAGHVAKQIWYVKEVFVSGVETGKSLAHTTVSYEVIRVVLELSSVDLPRVGLRLEFYRRHPSMPELVALGALEKIGFELQNSPIKDALSISPSAYLKLKKVGR